MNRTSFLVPIRWIVPALALFDWGCNGADATTGGDTGSASEASRSAADAGAPRGAEPAKRADRGDAAPDDDAETSGCTPPCGPGSVCVRDQVVGGALVLPDDAGACPVGRHLTGDRCERDPTFSCAATPAQCSGAVDCSCAATLCTQQGSCPYQCTSATSTEVECTCPVP